MGLRVVRFRSVIILVINKLDSHFAVVQFRNHSYDYRPNRAPPSPITIIYNTAVTTCYFFSPFTPKSNQFQVVPAASPEIWYHTVWRTWLSIAYSDERWLHYQFSLRHTFLSKRLGECTLNSGVKGLKILPQPLNIIWNNRVFSRQLSSVSKYSTQPNVSTSLFCYQLLILLPMLPARSISFTAFSTPCPDPPRVEKNNPSTTAGRISLREGSLSRTLPKRIGCAGCWVLM